MNENERWVDERMKTRRDGKKRRKSGENREKWKNRVNREKERRKRRTKSNIKEIFRRIRGKGRWVED